MVIYVKQLSGYLPNNMSGKPGIWNPTCQSENAAQPMSFHSHFSSLQSCYGGYTTQLSMFAKALITSCQPLTWPQDEVYQAIHGCRLQSVCVCGLEDMALQWKGLRGLWSLRSKHWTSRNWEPPSQFLEHWGSKAWLGSKSSSFNVNIHKAKADGSDVRV